MGPGEGRARPPSRLAGADRAERQGRDVGRHSEPAPPMAAHTRRVRAARISTLCLKLPALLARTARMARNGGEENGVSDAKPEATGDDHTPKRPYRAITRLSNGQITHVRDIQASNDAQAIQIAVERGVDVHTDLYSDNGLVQRFGARGT